MIQLKDQMGSLLSFKQAPLRIVSLVPSISELIWDLDLHDELVGVTKFCIHPKNLRKEKVTVGGTKNVKLSRLESLKPDLVIANLEENTKDEVEAIAQLFPTYVSDINTVDQMLRFINDMALICNREKEANEIINKINDTISAIPSKTKKKKAIYLIWNDPFMSIGGDTFISHMMEKVGFENCFAKMERYPVLTNEDIKRISPDELWLSSEPFPFKETHRDELQNKFPDINVRLVDGEAFSWYGSRIFKVKNYLSSF
tara:strand:- start:2459 stop:3229 length:771 start_codon:yes stop_codon:yes gene_type:complete